MSACFSETIKKIFIGFYCKKIGHTDFLQGMFRVIDVNMFIVCEFDRVCIFLIVVLLAVAAHCTIDFRGKTSLRNDLGRIRFVESGFRFTVNPDSDSLANRMVWIHGCCQK